jgi:hypothetical protein
VGHVKPTTEELEANAQKAAEEAEALKNAAPEKKEGEGEEEKKEDPPAKVEGEGEGSGEGEEGQDEGEEEKKEDPDYKKKFIDSSREAQILHVKDEKNKKLTDAIDQAESLTVTDEELQKEFPEWEDMTATEKRLAKDNFINQKRFSLIHKASLEGKDMEAWMEKVGKYLEDPQVLIDNPELEGKQQDFKVFASKPTRRGVPLEDLVKTFLWDDSKRVTPKKKGETILKGSASRETPEKHAEGKISLDDARTLRETNYPEYKRLLMAGKIATDDL